MRITTMFALGLIALLSGVVAAQEYAEYVNVQDGFKIDFPGQPAVRAITWTTQQDYKLPARVYSVDKGAEHYAVTVADYSGIEKMGIARSQTCISGDRPLCKGTDVAGPGVWKHDVREAMLFATLKFIQRPNIKASDFQTSMGWVDNTGKGIRYQNMYIGASHSMREFPVTAPTGGAPNAAAAR